MDKMFNVLDSYYQTLTKTGYLSLKISLDILIMEFIDSIKSSEDYSSLSCEYKKKLDKLYTCVTKTNCLI